MAIGGTVLALVPPAAAAETVLGAGSSFSALIVNQWRADAAADGISVNYQDTGSSQGRTLYLQGQVDFAMSDFPFQPEDRLDNVTSDRKNVQYLPLVAGALSVAFNVRSSAGTEITTLNLTPDLLCRMFTDLTMKWNDPALVAINPSAGLPDSAVRSVVRSDGSGTSMTVMEFCIATAPSEWSTFIAAVQAEEVAGLSADFLAGKPVPQWPQRVEQAKQPQIGRAHV